jgi:hypothetical protein
MGWAKKRNPQDRPARKHFDSSGNCLWFAPHSLSTETPWDRMGAFLLFMAGLASLPAKILIPTH